MLVSDKHAHTAGKPVVCQAVPRRYRLVRGDSWCCSARGGPVVPEVSKCDHFQAECAAPTVVLCHAPRRVDYVRLDSVLYASRLRRNDHLWYFVVKPLDSVGEMLAPLLVAGQARLVLGSRSVVVVILG